MQTLYALESQEDLEPDLKTAQGVLKLNLEQTEQIFTYLIYFIEQVARFSEQNARQRAARHLKTDEDLKVDTRIANNSRITQWNSDPGYLKKLQEGRLPMRMEVGLLKRIYLNLLETREYQAYTSAGSRSPEEDRGILNYLFRDILMKDESFGQHMEDNFLHWQDDRAMMELLVGHFIEKSDLTDFSLIVSPEKEAYAKELLQTVLEKKELCQGLIRPKLQNWDPDRIAAIDMLLMEMGICEFLFFPTIPTKVTINEYIDLAKAYSTPQSGQFVNGILDSILKDLEKQNNIHKTDRARK